jgi:hypothetical protein
MDRSRQRGAWIALAVALVWAVVGCGAEESASYDRDGSVQAVEEGKQALVELLNGQPDTVPYYELTEIGVVFEQAGELDPTYDEARFWSALFALPNFLEREDTRAFLAKLGWQGLKGSAAGAGDGEFDDFAERVGQTAGWAFAGVSGGTSGGADPPLHDFGLPNDPNVEDLNPCIDSTGTNQDCVASSDGWVPTPVILFGTDPYVSISFQELYDFLTGSLGDAVHGAVARLKAIGSDFSTSITAIPLSGEGTPLTITFDAFEVKLLQALYGVLDVVTSLPTLWTYTGFDAFWSAKSTRHPVTGEFIVPSGQQVVDDISTDDLIAYFKAGNDGLSGSGDEPLRSNPAGITRLRQALADLLEAAQSVLARLATGDALEGHLLTPALLFDQYDDQPRVLAYGAQALGSMVGDARAALNGPQVVTAYLPVATIQDFGTCEPLAGATADTAPMNLATVWAETSPAALTNVIDLTAQLGDSDHASVDVTGQTPPHTDGAYYVLVPLATVANLTIYTSTPYGTGGNTSGEVAYVTGTGRTALLNGWDSDEDSGAEGNFGLSIPAAYMQDAPGLMVGLPADPIALYVRVTNPGGTDFTLHVQRQPAEGGWPAGEPIFLKGGGRNFLARTYSYGSLTVNAGAALTLLSEFFDRSDRSTLKHYPEDPQIPQQERWELKFPGSVIRSSVLEVLPGTLFGDGFPSGTEAVDLFSLDANVTLNGNFLSAQPVAAVGFGEPLPFCAYPQDLGTVDEIAGGRTALGFW